MMYLQGFMGVFCFILLCCFCSEDVFRIRIKLVLTGFCVQILLAALVLKCEVVSECLNKIGKAVTALQNSTLEGTNFVFGYVGGGEVPFFTKEGANTFSLAFQALPMILVVSAISMLLFHWKVLPLVVRFFSFILQKTMGIGGALGVCGAAKIFLGQTEAPLLISPYLDKLSRSELFAVMTLGMATTSGTIMALYATMLFDIIPNALTHIITATIISIPASITIARIIVPEVSQQTAGELFVPYKFTNTIDAIITGTLEGGKLLINLIAILIVFVSLISFCNKMLGYSFVDISGEPLTLERILGFILAPFTWLMGISWDEAHIAGSLLGKKIILNEVYAFKALSNTPAQMLTAHSRLIMLYALCGFANLSSIGIQIGVLGTIAPTRRDEVISLVCKAMLAGTISTMISGTIVGLLSL